MPALPSLTLVARSVSNFAIRLCSNSLPCSDALVCGQAGFLTRTSGSLTLTAR